MSHDGDKFIAEEVVRHETGPSVVMNCSTFSNNKHLYIIAGQESHCQLYNVQSVLINETDEVEDIGSETELRQRKLKTSKVDNNKNIKKLKLVVKPSDSVQTDFLDNEPLQRVVRISPCGKLMATGIFKLFSNQFCMYLYVIS